MTKLVTRIACALGLSAIVASAPAAASDYSEPANSNDISFDEVIGTLIDTTGIAMHSIDLDTADRLVESLLLGGHETLSNAVPTCDLATCMTDGFDVRILDDDTFNAMRSFLRDDDDGNGAELLDYARKNNCMFTVFGGDSTYGPYVSVEDRSAYDQRIADYEAAIATRRLAA